MFKVVVEVYRNMADFEENVNQVAMYEMNHDRQEERRVLGIQCRNAFEAGQIVVTYPKTIKNG